MEISIGIACSCCREHITYESNDVYLVELCQALSEEDFLFKVCTTESGNYTIEPVFFHSDCWETTIIEEISGNVEDEPPVNIQSPVLLCTVCMSTIGEEQYFAMCSPGQLLMSKSSNYQNDKPKFENGNNQRPICLRCICIVVEEYIPEWEDLSEIVPVVDFEGDQDEQSY